MRFEEHPNELTAADAARNGQRPPKPRTTRFLAGSFDALWELLVPVWAHDDDARIAAGTVAQQLKDITLRRFTDPNAGDLLSA